MKHIIAIAILTLCLYPEFLWAQHNNLSTQDKLALIENDTVNNETPDIYEKKSYFSTGINFVNNNVYLGRKDSILVPYLTPYIGYHNKTGLYAKALLSLTNVPDTHIDLFTLEGGYQHSFGKVELGAAFDKYFFNNNSLSVKSNFKGSSTIFGIFTNDYLEPQVNFNVNFAQQTDYVLGGSVDHLFLALKDKLFILPTAAVYFGTQHYYNEYNVKKKQLVGNKVKTKTEPIVVDASKFQSMDYEFSVQVIYKMKHWVLIGVPQYITPIHPSNLTYRHISYPEKISDSFVFELDISYRY